MAMQDLQKDNGLVLGTLAKPHISSLGQIFGRLVSASILSTIRASTGVCVCIKRDNGVRGELGGGKMCVESRGQMRSEVGVGLVMLWESWQRGLGILRDAAAEGVTSHGW